MTLFCYDIGRLRLLIVTGSYYSAVCGKARKYPGKFSVESIQARHVDVWIPIAIAPGKINIFIDLLRPIFLANVSVIVNKPRLFLPLFTSTVHTGKNPGGGISVLGL